MELVDPEGREVLPDETQRVALETPLAWSKRRVYVPQEMTVDEKFSMLRTSDCAIYMRETATGQIRGLLKKVRGKSARRAEKAKRRQATVDTKTP